MADWVLRARLWSAAVRGDKDLFPVSRCVGLAIGTQVNSLTGSVILTRPSRYAKMLGATPAEINDGCPGVDPTWIPPSS